MLRRHTPMVVITGGPCAGKSTFLSCAVEYLVVHGIQPVVVSETATEMAYAQCPPGGLWLGKVDFQKMLIEYQLTRERCYQNITHVYAPTLPKVILCDRGSLDGRAYVPSREWNRIMRDMATNIPEQMLRYELVIHLVTAADGAEKFYTLENNLARTETPVLARRRDRRLIHAWQGHPHHIIVGNSGTFKEKMQAGLQSLARRLNLPVPLECERKFCTSAEAMKYVPSSAVRVEIVQTYLTSDDPSTERRIRAWTTYGVTSHFYTVKRATRQVGVRIETEEMISPEEYIRLLGEADTDLQTIRKTRMCFVYARQRCELDLFHTGGFAGQLLLEIEVRDMSSPVILPHGDYMEVTGNSRYSNYCMATGEK